jgi:hypothetical protein
VLLRGRGPRSRVVVATAAGVVLLVATVVARSVIYVPGFFPPVFAGAVTLSVLRSRREGASLAVLVPVVVAATTLGVLQSQGLVGSSFAIFPLLIVSLAALVRDVRWSVPDPARFAPALGTALAVALVVLGTIYTLSNARLAFVDVNAPGPVVHADYPTLAGLSATGRYLADLDEILAWTRDHVAADEGFVFLPGEDPVYFALGRRPALPSVYFFDVATPYSPEELARIADARGLRWVFVKDRLQLVETPPLQAAIVAALTARASLFAEVGAYRIYRR